MKKGRQRQRAWFIDASDCGMPLKVSVGDAVDVWEWPGRHAGEAVVERIVDELIVTDGGVIWEADGRWMSCQGPQDWPKITARVGSVGLDPAIAHSPSEPSLIRTK